MIHPLRGFAGAFAASAFFAAAPLAAEAPSGVVCELHVLGAQRDFSDDERLAGPSAPRGTPQADPNEPLAAINLFNPVLRAADLDHDALVALLPQASEVRVVRHGEYAEIGLARRSEAPLIGSRADCHAELIGMEFYDIGKPAREPGLTEGLAMAPDGWHATYIWRVFDGEGELVESAKESIVAPLRIARETWNEVHHVEVQWAIDEAIDTSLEMFHERLDRRRD